MNSVVETSQNRSFAVVNVNDDSGFNSLSVGLLALVFNLVILYFDQLFSGYSINFTAEIHLIGVVASVGLLLVSLLPKKLRLFRVALYLIAITYLLPFCTMYVMFLNQGDTLWQLLAFLTVILLTSSINSKSVCTVVAIGAFSAFVAYGALNMEVFQVSQQICFAVFSSLAFAAHISLNTTQSSEAKKIQNLQVVSGGIAHELRTPLMAITSGVKSISQHYNKLLSGYKAAIDHGLDVSKIHPQHLGELENIVQLTEKKCVETQHILEMLTIKGVGWSQLKEKAECGAESLVTKALESFPFQENERELVKVHLHEDFEFMANEKLMIQVINNLIKNAIYSVRSSGKGDVEIHIRSKGKKGEIEIKDTGLGIRSEDISYIFDVFYTDKAHGTGVGLAFCQLIVNQMGGTIDCHSEFKEWTQFKIKISNNT